MTTERCEPPPPPSLAQPQAAYVHVPFCRHRCGYCDFTVLAGRDDLQAAYLEALALELQAALPQPVEVRTIFIGGGTPTHLSCDDLRQLLDLLTQHLTLAPGGEWSVEANPHDLPDEKLHVLAAGGVTRLSLGVQSFDADVLAMLEREHSPAQARDAIARAARMFDRVSCDLIFGVPGQSLASWEATLAAAIASGVGHVSAYGLTIEKGTAFWSRRLHGRLHELEDEPQRAMQAAAMDRLAAAGLAQYELSNFARPGDRCRHNETYWAGGEFFGFGPGAAQLLGGERRTNHRSATTYVRRVLAGRSPTMETERIDPLTRARELIMLGLRRVEGLDTDHLAEQTGHTLETLAPGTLAAVVERGWVETERAWMRLTREGRFVADEVIAAFF